MTTDNLFFNPFRIISPRLDAEASRLTEMFESPPKEVTSAEEGLLVMTGKLIELAGLIRKALVLADAVTLDRCSKLARDIREEEKELTEHLVNVPKGTSDAMLKAVILYPGHLERAGDFLESLINVSRSKAESALPFSDKVNKDLDELFGLFVEMLKNFRDALVTRNRVLLETIINQEDRLGQMVVDLGLAHEDRLLACQCSPKASPIYLAVLYAIRNASHHFKVVSESLLNLSAMQKI